MDKYKSANQELALILFPHLTPLRSVPERLSTVLHINHCDWATNDASAFQLMVHYSCYPKSHELSDSILVNEHLEYYENHDTRAAAIRYAIVRAVMEKVGGQSDCLLDDK